MHRAGATPSQLDVIAEINARAARQLRARQALRLAVVGGAVLLGSALWWFMQGGSARAPASSLPAASVPVEPLRDGPAAIAQSIPPTSAAAVPAIPEPAAVPAQDAPRASAPMEAAAVPLAETATAADRARKARANALQVQQERSRVEAQERQQREAEREAQQAREPVDATSPRAAEQAPAPSQPAAEPRRGVHERCAASGNIFSELFCHSRECRKAEHANDAICIRLHEIEEVRRRGSQ